MSFEGIIDNPFDQATPTYAPETRRLEQILAQASHNAALGLRVALPGRIHAIRGDQTVDVQPLLKTRFVDKGVVDMAILQDVPVAMPQGFDWRVSYPLAVGDLGLCVFCDRNIDAFLASDGTLPQDPQDRRTHDLSDAVFFPGMVPSKMQTTDVQPSGDLVLGNGQATMRLRKNGSLAVENTHAELITVIGRIAQQLASLTSALSSAAIMTPSGAASFAPPTTGALSGVQNALQAIQNDLTTFQT